MRESAPHAVIFDFGRVLGHYDTLQTCRALSSFCSFSAEEILDAVFEGEGLKKYRIPYEVGAFSCETFFEHLRGHIGLTGLEFEDFKGHWPDVIGPVDGTAELLARLKGTAKLGILSNIDPINWAIAEAFPFIRENFRTEYCTLSFREKCRKPQPEIYRKAVDRLGTNPADTLFIDDRIENVEMAEMCGLHAEQYDCRTNTIHDLEDILQKHGVL